MNETILLTLGLLLERPMSPAELAATALERAAGSPLRPATPTAAEFATAATALRHAGQTAGHPGSHSETHALTDRGRAAFGERVAASLAAPDPAQPAFHTAVGYLGALERDTAVAALRARTRGLRDRAAELETALAAGAGIPRLFLIENEYALRMCRAELAWVEEALAETGTGALAWPRVEVTGDGWQWEAPSA
ncbi:PadR family transcriptional regulator [Streptomyces goshikiensis]|uniref:PadR family transcriptional regulator n=1 Tax=Streptomyces goshikiensis TaxID=1942 RepID=UPI00378E2755